MGENVIPKDLAMAVEFHGHLCPGLTIGYLAAKVGLERLGIGRAEDEELIAIVENDSCAVDAVQVLTGCTFGKGAVAANLAVSLAAVAMKAGDAGEMLLCFSSGQKSDELEKEVFQRGARKNHGQDVFSTVSQRT